MISTKKLLVSLVNLNQCRFTHNLLKNCGYINGKWVAADSGEKFPVKNPYDNTVIETVPEMGVSDVRKAITCASNVFPIWRDFPAKERGLLLRKWYELCCTNAEVLAEIITRESGKPISEARAEVKYGNSFIEWFSEESRRIDGEIIPSPIKQPIGAVALITPWNFPLAMITRKVSAALASGCTCVIKPAEDTPLTALALAQLSSDCGIPPGVINVVTAHKRENVSLIGDVLCTSPNIAGVSFTGSTEVGKILYKQCASTVKRIGLELGGNAPFIVFPSADVDLAVEGALASKFRNCGQTCVSSNRFLVHEVVHDTFVMKLKEKMEKDLILGDNMNNKTTIGPLINRSQFDKVKGFVEDAVSKGAKVIIGGIEAKQFGELFYRPTILVNVTEAMRCYNEEVFGPIVSCIKFRTTEEAVCIANGCRNGLAGYFYSNDVREIVRVSEQLEVGMVGINEGMISMAEAAFGGVKESGLGREGSHHGIDDYTYVKYLCLGNL